MSDLRKFRDLEAEENERISFVILQHVYTLGQEDGCALQVGRIASDLALPPERVVQAVAHLTYAGFLRWEGTGRPVYLTDKAAFYIETLAHRRHSVRLVTQTMEPG